MKTSGRLVVFLFGLTVVIVAMVFGQSALKSQKVAHQIVGKTLRILSYSAFVGSTGPGGELVAEFKKTCNCDVEILTAGDAGLLLERLKIARNSTPFDLVIGMDQLTVQDAEAEFQWKEHGTVGIPWQETMQRWATPHFVPYDWAPMTFIYRQSEIPPMTSIDDLLQPQLKAQIALEDPRSSTPGLQFVNWIVGLKGDKAADFFEKLKDNVQSISPSWSFSYGLFKKGQSKLVFSYVTSLVYHWKVEGDHRYQALIFREGHPYQVELAGIPKSCAECGLAADFLKTMLGPAGQKIISDRNFMFPAITGVELAPEFQQLPHLTVMEIPKSKDLSAWLRVFGK